MYARKHILGLLGLLLLLAMATGAGAQATYNPPSSVAASLPPGWTNVKTQYGASGNGTTDDTTSIQNAINAVSTAGGGTIYFPPGTYLVGGALQDTSASNCQLRIPGIAQTTPQITLGFVGAARPPFQFDPGAGAFNPVAGYSIIKSVLTGGTGTAALIAGHGPTNENNTSLTFQNLIFQMPSNPTLTCINQTDLQAGRIQDVLIHCGTVNLPSVTQPTHNNAYGVILCPVNHTPYDRIEGCTVFGYYTGFKLGENADGTGLRTWGCWIGFEAPFAYHSNLLGSIGTYWGPYGIKSTGVNYTHINLWDIEHANGAGQSWQNNIYDVDDASNNLHGEANYLAVRSSVGVTNHDFVKNSATGFNATQIGDVSTSGSTTAPGNPGWWDNGGAIAGAVAAYAAVGAASYVSSKTNLVNNTAYTLIDGTAVPTWAASTGWTFNGTSQYLNSGITAPSNQVSTVIVKYSGAAGAGKYIIGGLAGSLTYGIQPIDDGSTGSAKVAYLNGSYIRVAPSLTAGVLAMRGSTANRNGVDEGSAITAGTGSGVPFYIGAANNTGTTLFGWSGTITSIAYYSAVLTQAQVATVAAGMP